MPGKKVESNLVLRIRGLCKEKGISMRRLERDNQFGNGLVSKWSNSSPSVVHLQRVANYFEVTINYLLGEVDDRYEIPRSLAVMEKGEGYSVAGESNNPAGVYNRINVADVFEYLVKVTEDDEKAIVYDDYTLTLGEVKQVRNALNDIVKKCEKFSKK